MHIRPYINLQSQEEFELMKQMMIDVADLVLKYGGALSGEHGDGLLRSWLNPKMFGKELMKAFSLLKNAFDPNHLMNPGKIVDGKEPFEEMRLDPKHALITQKTFLNFSREGGFDLAVDLCNGNGQCRKKEGVMCPSFQVTNKEFHSTRARAQALRGIIYGRLPVKDLTSKEMHEVMDLCISCKGCKTECPSQVDMAKMKAEFSYQYHRKHGYPLRSYLFGFIGKINQLLQPMSGLSNKIGKMKFVKKGLSYLGISEDREFPTLAKVKFSSWFQKMKQESRHTKQIVLFNDTFTEFNHPDIGQAAFKIFDVLGYQVLVPKWNCCGRPALSKGLLEQARHQAHRVIELLFPYAEKGIPIIGLEPSCILTIRDDYVGLLHETHMVNTVIQHCYTLDEFLLKLVKEGSFQLPFKGDERKVRVHGHCHQKALVGMKPTLEVLRSIPGFQVEEIQSGCCGMAGSFGYEKEHYDISMQMGEMRLFPAVRNCGQDTLLIASGMSCRHQIADGTGKIATHLAVALADNL